MNVRRLADSGRPALADSRSHAILPGRLCLRGAGSLSAAVPDDFINKISWRMPSGLTLPVDSSHKTGTGEVAEWLKAALC